MATRFYLPSTGSAPISPSYSAGWEDTSIAARLPCYTTKQSTAMTTVSFTDSDATNKDVLFRQYISEPLAGQIIDVQALEFQMRVKERATSCNLFLTLNVKLVSNDNAALRGTLFNMVRDGAEADATSIMNRRLTGNTSFIRCYSGDRLVFEVGMAGDPAAGSDHDSDIRIGDADASDLTEDDTSTTDNNPWIEFPNTLTFHTANDIILNEISSGSTGGGGGSNLTFAHPVTTNLTNKGLLVLIATYDGTSSANAQISTVTYNGDAMTRLVNKEGIAGTNNWSEIWFLATPDTGSNNVVITPVGSSVVIDAAAVTLANVASTQPDTTGNSTTNSANNTSVSNTPTTDRTMSFSMTTCETGTTGLAGGASQVHLIASTPTVLPSYSDVKTPVGAVTHTYTGGSATDRWVTAIAAINKYTAPSTAIKDIIGSGFIPFPR